MAFDLDGGEVRVLGALIEKDMATPEYYPLSLNALMNACNQKSNREPVMDLSESEVTEALDALQHQVLAWKVMGARAVHWKHNLDGPWQLDAPMKAIVTLLLLRGPQTPGELRGRSERLHRFESVDEVEQTLRRLAGGDEPLVVELERQPGQKERRWMHLASGAPSQDLAQPAPRAEQEGNGISARVERLEMAVERLGEELRALKERLGET